MATISALGGLSRTVDSQGKKLPSIPPVLSALHIDEVLLNCDFSQGLDGWHTHTTFYPPYLSDHAISGNSMALRTGEGAESTVGGKNTCYKRVAETFQDGYILYLAWLAFRGKEEHANPGVIALRIDHQSYDDTARSFPGLFLRRWVHTSTVEKYSPRWSLYPDQVPTSPAANVFVDIPGGGASKYPAVAGKGAVPGWNVNHAGFWLAGLIVSCNASDNESGVGIGRYMRAIIGNEVIDISSLKTNSHVTENGENTHSGEGTGTGSGAENPQVESEYAEAPNHASSFSGGLNFGLTVNNTGEGAKGEAALFADHVFAAHIPPLETLPTGSEG